MWWRSFSLTGCGRSNRGLATSGRAGQAGVGGADWLQKARDHLRKADPMRARLIADRPDFDPRRWMTELPPMDLFGALLFQIVGQQLSVAATRMILERKAVRTVYRLDHLPAEEEVLAIAEKWRPYRSLATAYLFWPRSRKPRHWLPVRGIPMDCNPRSSGDWYGIAESGEYCYPLEDARGSPDLYSGHTCERPGHC